MAKRNAVVLAGLCAALLLAGCAATGGAFSTSVPAGPTPWTSTAFDDAPSDFSFAVVADLESGYRAGVFDTAVGQLALMRPAFVMTIGDMIDGGTEDTAQLEEEWTAFDAMLKPLHAPFFHVAGNHDLTSLEQRRIWKTRYGPRYYDFVYKDVLFLVVDTEDYLEAKMKDIFAKRAEFIEARKTDPAAARALPYASLKESRTGEISAEQSAQMEKAIAAHPNVRWTFVLMHKPAYERADDLGLGRIERALKGRPYTVLNGHLHRYLQAEREGRDYIMLGTTGGEFGGGQAGAAMDHFMWVRMTKDGPSIANLKLDGVLDKTGDTPGAGENLCVDRGGPGCRPVG